MSEREQNDVSILDATKEGEIIVEREPVKPQKKRKRGCLIAFLITLVVLLGIACVALCALSYDLHKRMNRRVYEVSLLTSECKDLKETIRRLNAKIDSLENEKKAALAKVNRIASSTPLIITNIDVANADYDNNIIGGYGSTIYSSKTMYIKPRITYTGFRDGSIDLELRWIRPSGELTHNDASKGKSYSTHNTYTISTGSDRQLALRGWGGRTKGHWAPGTYTLEIAYEGKVLASRSVVIK